MTLSPVVLQTFFMDFPKVTKLSNGDVTTLAGYLFQKELYNYVLVTRKNKGEKMS